MLIHGKPLRPPKLDAHWDHEPQDRSAGLRYGSTAAISHEPCLEAGAPVHGKRLIFFSTGSLSGDQPASNGLKIKAFIRI
jgi:hypothetical protein